MIRAFNVYSAGVYSRISVGPQSHSGHGAASLTYCSELINDKGDGCIANGKDVRQYWSPRHKNIRDIATGLTGC